MPILKNARLTLVTCRPCPRQHPLRVDPDTRRTRACRGFAIPLRSGNPLPRAFNRLLNAPCTAGQRVPDLDLDLDPDHHFIIARLPAHGGGTNRR